MRKILSWLLILVTVLGVLTGCGSKETTDVTQTEGEKGITFIAAFRRLRKAERSELVCSVIKIRLVMWMKMENIRDMMCILQSGLQRIWEYHWNMYRLRRQAVWNI